MHVLFVYELHPFESVGLQVMINISAQDVNVLKHIYTSDILCMYYDESLLR